MKLIFDLQATPRHVYWPGFDLPPSTSEGILWHAAHLLKKTAPFIQVGISAMSMGSPAQEAVVQRLGMTVAQKAWRQKESKNYSNALVNLFLDMVEEILPCGRDIWEALFLRYNKICSIFE